MGIKRFFYGALLFSLPVWGVVGSSRSLEAKKIDQEIEQLQQMKRGYEARALKHEDMAEYLQFDQQAVLETRRHLKLAEENRNKAALIQQEIDRLQKKKQSL